MACTYPTEAPGRACQLRRAQMAEPVAMSVTSASLRLRSLPRPKPSASVEETTYRSVSSPGNPMPRIAPKVTWAWCKARGAQ